MQIIMGERWYIYIAIAALSALLYWACDKLQILKPKPLRIFVVLLIASLICWGISDIVCAPA